MSGFYIQSHLINLYIFLNSFSKVAKNLSASCTSGSLIVFNIPPTPPPDAGAWLALAAAAASPRSTRLFTMCSRSNKSSKRINPSLRASRSAIQSNSPEVSARRAMISSDNASPALSSRSLGFHI